MSQPGSTNLLHLAHLAAVLRPVFRCPTTPAPVHELYCRIVDALDGQLDSELDAVETALLALIMLRNATATAHVSHLAVDACVDVDDSDPDIGLHLALFGVQQLLGRLGWRAQRAA